MLMTTVAPRVRYVETLTSRMLSGRQVPALSWQARLKARMKKCLIEELGVRLGLRTRQQRRSDFRTSELQVLTYV